MCNVIGTACIHLVRMEEHTILSIGPGPLHRYAFVGDAIHPFAYMVRLNGQLPTEAPIDKDQQLHLFGSPERQQGILAGSDRAPGVQYVVHQHHRPAFQREIKISGTGSY